MSFQGYLNTIKAKTGKGPDDFRRLAAEKGFTEQEPGDVCRSHYLSRNTSL